MTMKNLNVQLIGICLCILDMQVNCLRTKHTHKLFLECPSLLNVPKPEMVKNHLSNACME